MSCIIFRYRRFYAIICKITHFFYPERKNPPLFAHSATALSFKMKMKDITSPTRFG